MRSTCRKRHMNLFLQKDYHSILVQHRLIPKLKFTNTAQYNINTRKCWVLACVEISLLLGQNFQSELNCGQNF